MIPIPIELITALTSAGAVFKLADFVFEALDAFGLVLNTLEKRVLVLVLALLPSLGGLLLGHYYGYSTLTVESASATVASAFALAQMLHARRVNQEEARSAKHEITERVFADEEQQEATHEHPW